MPQKNTHLKRVQHVLHGDLLTGASHDLDREYRERMGLFELQSPLIQRFLEAQAAQLSQAILQNLSQAKFTLPDHLISTSTREKSSAELVIPASLRDQTVGGVFDRLSGTDLRTLLRIKLIELESSENQAVNLAALMMRHAIALHLVYRTLPSGRSVTYRAAPDEEIPTFPQASTGDKASAITAKTDAIAEEVVSEADRGELQVPYVPYARQFYLPQWVALDENGRLLVKSLDEAESYLASMQHYISVLHAAVSLAPYFVFDPEYRQKRYGMLGQLINQGRALACYETFEIIRGIKDRASAQSLNRGLSLSLPYFDDQALEIHLHNFVVIPTGRIMFSPLFVIQAAREEQVKVAQDTRLSPSTRKHLLSELREVELAFHGSLKSN